MDSSALFPLMLLSEGQTCKKTPKENINLYPLTRAFGYFVLVTSAAKPYIYTCSYLNMAE